jgi:hypothetical protein
MEPLDNRVSASPGIKFGVEEVVTPAPKKPRFLKPNRNAPGVFECFSNVGIPLTVP